MFSLKGSMHVTLNLFPAFSVVEASITVILIISGAE
jgi:hypothetical protein